MDAITSGIGPPSSFFYCSTLSKALISPCALKMQSRVGASLLAKASVQQLCFAHLANKLAPQALSAEVNFVQFN